MSSSIHDGHLEMGECSLSPAIGEDISLTRWMDVVDGKLREERDACFIPPHLAGLLPASG